MPPLPHDVVARAADQAAAVERPDERALVDADLQPFDPGRQPARADRAEGAPAQVKLRLEVVIGAEGADVQAAQNLTRAFP
jgi:hypothetical protein